MTDSYHQLSDKWVMWFHDPFDSEWGLDSYVKMCEIDTIENFWSVFNKIDKNLLIEGMFFLMKEGIKPLWEDEKNIDGGCWSYRIQKKIAYEAWVNLSIALCGNQLINEKYNENLNGISISPKKSFCIVKIWNNDSKINTINVINKIEKLDNRESIFKAHKDRNY